MYPSLSGTDSTLGDGGGRVDYVGGHFDRELVWSGCVEGEVCGRKLEVLIWGPRVVAI